MLIPGGVGDCSGESGAGCWRWCDVSGGGGR